MSHRYKLHDQIPNDVLATRLDELSNAITDGKEARDREFTMRIPAEPDRDADLVLAAAARRIREYAKFSPQFAAVVAARTVEQENRACLELARALNADLDRVLHVDMEEKPL